MFARLRIALEHFTCFGSTAERDAAQELLKQPLQILAKPFSLAGSWWEARGQELLRDHHLLASACQVSPYQSSETHGRRDIVLEPSARAVPRWQLPRLLSPHPRWVDNSKPTDGLWWWRRAYCFANEKRLTSWEEERWGHLCSDKEHDTSFNADPSGAADG